MKKKPASLEALMSGAQPQPEGVVSTTAPDVVRVTKSVEKLTVYVPRAAAKRLKQMALDHDRRVNDFLQEGVDLMLAKYGQPALKDFEG